MANENIEISDIIKKCKILLLDIEGTTTSISFVKDKLFPYAEENVKEFLDTKWEEDDVKEVVTALRKLALEDQEKSVEGVVAIPGEDASKEDQIEGLVKNVKWQMASDRKAGPLKQLQGLIWKQGYDKGDIKGHVYDDVLPALEQWRSVEGHKIYIYSSGSVQAQKLLFGQSSSGDLLPHIDGHFDTAVGAKQEESSYKAIAEKIDCKLDEILFLTDIVKEAAAARAAGVRAALVSREGNAPLPADATAAYPVLHSLAQLTATNKRKPDSQDEQPAKVPKTETDGDVKTAADETAEKSSGVSEKPAEAVEEKMEVEDKPDDIKENTPDTTIATAAKVETVIEEVVEKDLEGTPDEEMKPVIEEVAEQPEESKTEKMETEAIVKEEEKPAEDKANELKDKVKDKNDGAEKAPVAEETPPTVITEIVEMADDKQNANEVAEVIEDIEPIVEEPPAAEDIEDLKSVGEVLEKECDEILSKVQDVTNLDNIPLKPLHPIAEENMETENIDSNDIVDKILDTEMELAMKPCEDIPVSGEVAEAAEVKTDEKCKKADSGPEAVKDDKIAEIPEEKKEESKEIETVCSTDKSNDKTNEKEEAKSEPAVDSATCTEVKTPEVDNSKATPEDTKMDTEVKAEESKANTDEIKTDEKCEVEDKTEVQKAEVETSDSVSKESPAESSTDKEITESKEVCTEEVKTDSEITDAQINGNTTNGESATVNLNGDTSKEEELSARLSVENGKETVNGSNGNSVEEQGQGDNKVEIGVADIKVKSVATDETRSDPIEQPTEA